MRDKGRGGVDPLSVVERRLDDGYRFWKQAEESYFDPDDFRLAAQAAIQTLRTVTFVLQSQKGQIEGFEPWYAQWQDRLRAEPLMRWLVDARNTIEKQGDLETHSVIRAEVIASYDDRESPKSDVPAELFEGHEALLKSIPQDVLEHHVLKHGLLRIQRRWVANSLPEYELLDALAIAYSRLGELLDDAHRFVQEGQRAATEGASPQTSPVAPRKNLLMIGHNEARAISISLADGTPLELEQREIHILPEQVAKFEADPAAMQVLETFRRAYRSVEELASAFFELFRETFERDGYHVPVIFLLKGTEVIGQIGVKFEGPKYKYLIMRQVAIDVARSGADGILFVNEAWTAPAEDVGPYQFASEVPSKRERLLMHVVTKHGDPLDYSALVDRSAGVRLEDTWIDRGPMATMFMPIYQMWDKPIPEEWRRWMEK